MLQMYTAFKAMEAKQYSSLTFLQLTEEHIRCLTRCGEHTDAYPSSLLVLATYWLYQPVNNWSEFINCVYPCTSLFVRGKRDLNKNLPGFYHRGVLPRQLQGAWGGHIQYLQSFSDGWTHTRKKIKIILFNQLKTYLPCFCNIIYLNCKNRD